MASITIPLLKPVMIGEKEQREVVLGELSPNDIIEASLESERAVLTDQGYQFMISPALMGVNTLLRQIESIGDYTGPVTREILGRFSREDFELMQLEAEQIDNAVMEAVFTRGRNDASGGHAGTDDN